MDDTQHESYADGYSQAAELYADFARKVTAALAAVDGTDVAARLDDLLEQLRAQLTTPLTWTDPAEAWSRMLAGFEGMAAGAGPGEAGADADLAAWLSAWTPIPLLGPLREWQRLLRDVGLAATRQSQAQVALSAHYRNAMVAAIDAFREHLSGAQGRAADSLDELHRQWTDIADRCYRDVAMGDAFSRDFGNAVNQASAFKQAMNAFAERMSTLTAAPGPDTFESLERRLADLEKAMAAQAHVPATSAPDVATTQPVTPVPASDPPASTARPARRRAPKKPAAKRTTQNRAPSRKTNKARPRSAEFDIADFLPADG